MAMNDNGGGKRRASVLTLLSWLIMGVVFLGLAGLQIYKQGFAGSLGTLAIDVIIGLSGLGIAFLTWRGNRR
jgi:hypothetical protein